MYWYCPNDQCQIPRDESDSLILEESQFLHDGKSYIIRECVSCGSKIKIDYEQISKPILQVKDIKIIGD